MRRSIVTTILATLAFAAQAHDGVEPSLRTKALASAAGVSKQAEAPFTTYGRDPLPQLLLLDELDRPGTRSGCEASAKDMCYDLAEGRVVYRAARAYMPKVDGLTAESVSLRQRRIVIKYSFR
jgi:hypothetical protein